MADMDIKELLRAREEIARSLRATSPPFVALEALDKLISGGAAPAPAKPEEDADGIKNADWLAFQLERLKKPTSAIYLGSLLKEAGRTQLEDSSAVAASVSSTLSRDKRFTSLKWNGRTRWWFAGKPVPPEPRLTLTKKA